MVPGATIDSAQARHANGARLQTALQGNVIRVRVESDPAAILMQKYNKKLGTPKVILSQVDINKGKKQFAHGIDRVLIPVKKLSFTKTGRGILDR